LSSLTNKNEPNRLIKIKTKNKNLSFENTILYDRSNYENKMKLLCIFGGIHIIGIIIDIIGIEDVIYGYSVAFEDFWETYVELSV
jgi:hypothetical protein